MKPIVVLIFLLAAATSSLLCQNSPEEVRQQIRVAQDTRNVDSISRLLTDNDPDVRAFAAFVCGSVQDTSHILLLSKLLADSNSSVRTAAAFALGQYNYVLDTVQRTFVSRALLARLGFERGIETLIRLVEALGKVGDEHSLNVVVASGMNFQALSLKCETALSVGRYAYRNIVSKTATAFAADILATIRSGDEWKAAYAFMRINDASLVAHHADQIVSAASHQSADVRMFAALALGKCSTSTKAVNALVSLVTSDPDWRVRVNAVKAIARMDTSFHTRILPLLFQSAADSSEHISLTAISSLGEMEIRRSPFSAACRKTLVEILFDRQYSSRQRREASIGLAKFLGADAFPILADKFRTGQLTERQYVPALAHTPDPDALSALINFAKGTDPGLQREALEAIQILAGASQRDSEWVRTAIPVFLTSLQSRDVSVVAAAASALARPVFFDARSGPALVETLRRLKVPDDADAILAVIQASGAVKSSHAIAPLESELNNPDRHIAVEAAKSLLRITGKSYAHFLKAHTMPVYTNHDWEMWNQIRKNPAVRVKTSKGMFTFNMLPDEAPFTSINFGLLIKRGFFDGLLFHRVVPNFVIQGGDPRGDGWGGPGYAIRSEFGFEYFGRGTVGVASSGKDTEGCQWFVTHCNTPHLDGRYTIFGKVTAGMDVVDAIEVGDRIEEMRFAE
ncbi:MAG: peptidylprolyl isomerase [Bacteroidetes bacterium]|nr:peptidylprolyl isomerase [Bacteroidota bacterium]MCW5897318.1 peptidylprolyl isomerase [Bacteroidota bacterium]